MASYSSNRVKDAELVKYGKLDHADKNIRVLFDGAQCSYSLSVIGRK